MTKYVYISDALTKTVRDSQVINWLEVYDSLDINFDLYIITPITVVLFANSTRLKKKKLALQRINGSVKEIFTIRRKEINIITNLITFIYFMLFAKFRSRDKIVIVTRTKAGIKGIVMLKEWCNNVKLIYDNRGARPHEYINSLGFDEPDEIHDNHIVTKYNQELKLYRYSIINSDVVFCVSKNLIEYSKKVTDYLLDDRKFIHAPGGADETHFYYSDNIRNKSRAELGFSNETVFVFSGELMSTWQNAEKLFQFLSFLLKESSGHFFLCITPNTDHAMKLANKYSISRCQINVVAAQFYEMNDFLNAADYAVIIRDDIVTNNVASPTKIAEYLLSGLPVLTTKGIGDYSDFIKINKIGYIIEIDKKYPVCGLSKNEDRSRISRVSRPVFGKQHIACNTSKVLLNI